MPADTVRVQTLFRLASSEADPQTRDSLLARECAGDSDLFRAVRALLEPAHTTFEPPPPACEPEEIEPTRVQGKPSPPRPGDAREGALFAGRYRLERKVGEGGMGEVWAAEQIEPIRRRVAVKLIRSGASSPALLARFEQERQVLALMDHPHVARVFDAGLSARGEPYFVMELIDGVPLSRYCEEAKVPPRERLALLVPVCRAVQHAHQKGIVHRDLKPGNVLVARVDGVAVPKVIDFGVAKAVDPLPGQNCSTEAGGVVGTPEYLSPEQADGGGDVDTRSDVYALGVLLYEQLTGTVPFSRELGMIDLLRSIKEVDPPRPSARLAGDPRAKDVRGDLDWIVMKCLEKDRSRRYATADELAQELCRYLADEPVLAGPPAAGYRLGKFVKRNRAAVLAAAAVLLALVAGLAGTAWGLVEARRGRAAAEQAAEQQREAKDLAEKRRAQAAKTNELLKNVFRNLDPMAERQSGRPLRALLADDLERATKDLQKDAVGDPLEVARLQVWLARAQLGLGHQARSAELSAEALATFERLLGPDDEESLAALGGLAKAKSAAGEYAEAAKLHAEALKRRRAKHGAADPEALASLADLADAYRLMGDPGKALPLLREAAEGAAKQFGPDDDRALAARSNLAVAHLQAGRHELALPLLEDVHRRRQKTNGDSHAATLASAIHLADARDKGGNKGEARQTYERALALAKRHLGPDHPVTMSATNDLGAFYSSQKQHDLALPMLRETLTRRRERLGFDHPDSLATLNDLASAYRAAGKHDDAVPLFEHAREQLKAILGPTHPHVIGAASNLASVYLAAGRYDRIGPAYLESIDLVRKKHGDAAARDAMDQAAAQLLRPAKAHTRAREPDKAVAVYRAYFDVLKLRHGPQSEARLQAESDAINELTNSQGAPQAEPLARESLAWVEKAHGDDWRTYATRSRLANVLLTQNKVREAEALLLDAAEGLMRHEAKIPPTNPQVSLAIQRLVIALDRQGKKAEAAKWREELRKRQKK